MSISLQRIWLICYDIRAPRRIHKVHRYLRGQGLHLQYSVFAARLNERQLRNLLSQLTSRIDWQEDDVRIYPVPSVCEAVALGQISVPRGVVLPDEQFVRLLQPAPRGHVFPARTASGSGA